MVLLAGNFLAIYEILGKCTVDDIEILLILNYFVQHYRSASQHKCFFCRNQVIQTSNYII